MRVEWPDAATGASRLLAPYGTLRILPGKLLGSELVSETNSVGVLKPGQRPPAHLYEPSQRRYPRKLLRPQPQSWTDVCRVENDGSIRWRHRKLHVTNALIGEYVELERVSETRWEVRYGEIVLGTLNTENMQHGMIRRRMRIAEVSRMSVATHTHTRRGSLAQELFDFRPPGSASASSS